MDWSRTGSFIDLINWLLLTGLSWTGGWLLGVHLFHLKPRERLFAGPAIGLLLLLLSANLLAQLLPLTLAYWLAAVLTLSFGLILAVRKPRRERFPLSDLAQWPAILAFGALFFLFLAINRGLAIFDDYSNIPLVSMIASGDIPPHFYLNPEIVLDYHYGLHLLAASLVRIGGFYPWAALDVYKALSMALSTVLGVLWFRRFMRFEAALIVGGLFVLFAGGARWLMLFLPAGLLAQLGEQIELIGSAMQTASDLPGALSGAWRIEGDGPFPFPFAFISGVSRPLTLAMGSNSALPTMTLFLLLLLTRRRWQPAAGVVFGLLLAAVSLASDHLFALLWTGLALAAGVGALQRRSMRVAQNWVWVLLPGALLVPLMGGTLTKVFERLAAPESGGLSAGGVGLPGMALRWPPAVTSSHLGALSLTDPAQLLLALIEIGPLLLLAIPVTLALPSYLRSGKLFHAGLALMAFVSFCAPLLIRFIERERDITRLTGAALTLWAALGLPIAWCQFRRSRPGVRVLLGAAFVTVIFGGVAILPSQLIATLHPQASYYIQDPDIQMSRAHWDRLEPRTWVLDPTFPYRPAALFARTTGPAFRSAYIELPEFLDLLNGLTPGRAAAAGYDFIYIDRATWGKLSREQKREVQHECVALLDERLDQTGDFRRLYDIRKCVSDQP